MYVYVYTVHTCTYICCRLSGKCRVSKTQTFCALSTLEQSGIYGICVQINCAKIKHAQECWFKGYESYTPFGVHLKQHQTKVPAYFSVQCKLTTFLTQRRRKPRQSKCCAHKTFPAFGRTSRETRRDCSLAGVETAGSQHHVGQYMLSDFVSRHFGWIFSSTRPIKG